MLKAIKRCLNNKLIPNLNLRTNTQRFHSSTPESLFKDPIIQENTQLKEIHSTMGLLMDWPLFPTQKKIVKLSKEKMNFFDSIGNHSRVVGLFPKKDQSNHFMLSKLEG
jgi:hypothetical protein